MFSKRDLKFLVAIFAGIIIMSCERPPDLPDRPSIEFENIDFNRSGGGGQDSLILTIRFEDGDGDLGLGENDNFPPYHEFDFLTESGNLVFDPNSVAFNQLVLFSEVENAEFNNNEWIVLNFTMDDQIETDTFGIVPNENFNNIFVDFFLKIGEDQYEKIDLGSILGNIGGTRQTEVSFDGRFPVLDQDGGGPLEGSLRYTMRSAGFFISPILRQEVSIQDRGLNRSNTISTPDFRIIDLSSGGG